MAERIHRRTILTTPTSLLFLLSLFFAAIAIVECSRPEFTRRASAQSESSDTITTLGCLDGEPGNLRFENETGVYTLTGDTAPLIPQIGKAVRIKGAVSAWLETPGRAIQVISSTAIFNAPAPLDRVLGDPAYWHNQIDRRYGVSIAFPGNPVSSADAVTRLRPRLPLLDEVAAVHRSAIPRGMYPASNFAGGYFAVFVDPDLSDPARCGEAPARRGAWRSSRNTLTIAGADYSTELESVSVQGETYRREYLHTFRNGLCYEFAFLFAVFDRERYGNLGCFTPAADTRELAALIVSEASFFPPEIGRPAR